MIAAMPTMLAKLISTTSPSSRQKLRRSEALSISMVIRQALNIRFQSRG